MRKSPDEIHIAVLDKIDQIVSDKYDNADGTTDFGYTSAYAKDILALYTEFCKTMIGQTELVAMQERIAWMELMIHNKGKEND